MDENKIHDKQIFSVLYYDFLIHEENAYLQQGTQNLGLQGYIRRTGGEAEQSKGRDIIFLLLHICTECMYGIIRPHTRLNYLQHYIVGQENYMMFIRSTDIPYASLRISPIGYTRNRLLDPYSWTHLPLSNFSVLISWTIATEGLRLEEMLMITVKDKYWEMTIDTRKTKRLKCIGYWQ